MQAFEQKIGLPTGLEALLTPKEASLFLRVPMQTLAIWRCKGAGPSWSKIGRHVRYSMDGLLEFVAANSKGGAA